MAEQDPADPTVEKPKAKLKLLIIPLALLSMGAGGFVTFSQYPNLSRVVAMTGVSAKEEPPEEGTSTNAPVEYGVFAQIEGLTVNPQSHDGMQHYLLTSIGIEAAKQAVLDEVAARDIVVRDTIIKLMSARTMAELASLEGRDALKTDVRDAINDVLRKGKIDRVYFTQYVLQ